MSDNVKATVKNTEDRPVVVHSVGGPVLINPGETSPELEFTAGEHSQNQRLYEAKISNGKKDKKSDGLPGLPGVDA